MNAIDLCLLFKKHSSCGESLEGAGAGDGILFGGATIVVQVRDDSSFPRVVLSALTVLSVKEVKKR